MRSSSALTRAQQAARIVGHRGRTLFDWRLITQTVIVVAAIVVTGAVDDRRSCERQPPVREAFHRFAGYQAVFQGGLAALDVPDGPTTVIVDPDTHQTLRLTRSELRGWVQGKQRSLVDGLPIPDCSTIPAGK